MTGVSRFLELPPPWRYSKDESLRTPTDFQKFSFLLTAADEEVVAGFEVAHEAHGFARLQKWPPAQQWVERVPPFPPPEVAAAAAHAYWPPCVRPL